jgi:hypothetical protein
MMTIIAFRPGRATPADPRITRLSKPAPLRVALAAACGLLVPTCLWANETVILKAGNRIEVERAYQTGDEWNLHLVGGGNITLPASAIKRVSSMAADMPASSAPSVVKSGATAMSPVAPVQAETAAVAPAPELQRFVASRAGGVRSSLVPSSRLATPLAPASLSAIPGASQDSTGRSLVAQAQARSVLNDPFRQGAFRRISGPMSSSMDARQRGGSIAVQSQAAQPSSGRLPRLH